MKRIGALVIALLMLLCLAAVAEDAAPQADSVSEGYTITDRGVDIALWENASTGYAWEYELDDETVLDSTGEETVLNASDDAVGAPTMRIWHFEAKGDGEALLSFYYERPSQDEEIPERMLYFTVTVEGGVVIDCYMEDLSDEEGGDDDAVVSYAGETGGVELEVFSDMTESQTPEGVLLTSEDGLTTILIKYEPADDADELFEQLKDDASAASVYDDEENGVTVISSDVDLEGDVPCVTMVYYVQNGIAEYTGYKAPAGGVLHVHTTYFLSDDDEEYEWPEGDEWDEGDGVAEEG